MDDKDSVKESFLARLQDENLAVVKALLKDPQVMSAVLESFYYSDLFGFRCSVWRKKVLVCLLIF